jgi:hypothetical protein
LLLRAVWNQVRRNPSPNANAEGAKRLPIAAHGAAGLRCTGMQTPSLPRAFLLNYQQATSPSEGIAELGTRTKTMAREGADQDAGSWLFDGTGTFTETREQRDQDPTRHHLAFGTGTRTDSRETADSDPGQAGWAIIPRA